MNEKVPATKLKAQRKYVKPATKKHEPVKVVQGSGGGGCGSLYYTSLYYL
ncbi:MAG TPA: hypothetical protein VL486_11045 [Verrucomicrobiae bacterium]|nr:hypothetical protein [Verrucomicrobiae bacterium]